MGTHSSFYADADNAVVVVRQRSKHPALGLEASRAWTAHTRALELQRLAVRLAAEHSQSARRDLLRRRMRLSVLLLCLVAVCVLALVVAGSYYGRQIGA